MSHAELNEIINRYLYECGAEVNGKTYKEGEGRKCVYLTFHLSEHIGLVGIRFHGDSFATFKQLTTDDEKVDEHTTCTWRVCESPLYVDSSVLVELSKCIESFFY
jgi:hypothetical protein